jgi:hypothetical protein
MEGNGGSRSVDATQVNAALDAKGIPPKCPVCGEVGFGIANRLALVTPDERPRSLDNSFEAVCMTCNYCGWVRLHAASVLLPQDASG